MSDPFLASSAVIDWHHRAIGELVERLLSVSSDRIDFVRRAFEWVRDEIRHTGDFQDERVTCAASDVLAHRTGFCYAKSHLFVALCRAKGVRAGVGYQRLSIEGAGAPFCLHGFAVIDLAETGWRRLDPRGNKPGIATEFSAIRDSLAFCPSLVGERTMPEVHAEPLAVVVEALNRYPRRAEFCNHLPDASWLS